MKKAFPCQSCGNFSLCFEDASITLFTIEIQPKKGLAWVLKDCRILLQLVLHITLTHKSIQINNKPVVQLLSIQLETKIFYHCSLLVWNSFSVIKRSVRWHIQGLLLPFYTCKVLLFFPHLSISSPFCIFRCLFAALEKAKIQSLADASSSLEPQYWNLNISKCLNFWDTSVFNYWTAGKCGVDILSVTSYFLLDLSRLEDSFSFLEKGKKVAFFSVKFNA